MPAIQVFSGTVELDPFFEFETPYARRIQGFIAGVFGTIASILCVPVAI